MEVIMVRTNITPTPATVNNQILVNNNNKPNNPTPRQGLDIPVIPTNQTTTTPVVRPRGRVQEVQGWTPAQPTRPCLLTSATWAAEVCHTHCPTLIRVRTPRRRLRRDTRTFTRWDERELIRFSEIPVTITHTPVILFMFVVILLSSKYTSAAHSTTRIFTKITLRFIPKILKSSQPSLTTLLSKYNYICLSMSHSDPLFHVYHQPRNKQKCPRLETDVLFQFNINHFSIHC